MLAAEYLFNLEHMESVWKVELLKVFLTQTEESHS